MTQIRIKKKTSADSHYDNLVQNVLYLDNDGDGCVCVYTCQDFKVCVRLRN